MKKKSEKEEKRWRNALEKRVRRLFPLRTLSSIVLVLCVPNTKKGFSTKSLFCSVFFCRVCYITRASLFIIRAPLKRKMIAFLKKYSVIYYILYNSYYIIYIGRCDESRKRRRRRRRTRRF